MYIDKLDDIVNEYNNTYHRAIRMKSIDIKNNTFINIDKEVKVGDNVRISNTKAFLLKVILQIGLSAIYEQFAIKEIKNTVP